VCQCSTDKRMCKTLLGHNWGLERVLFCFVLGTEVWIAPPALSRVGNFWDKVTGTICPGLASNLHPPYLCLLSLSHWYLVKGRVLTEQEKELPRLHCTYQESEFTLSGKCEFIPMGRGLKWSESPASCKGGSPQDFWSPYLDLGREKWNAVG
jgi:hypothetical protein